MWLIRNRLCYLTDDQIRESNARVDAYLKRIEATKNKLQKEQVQLLDLLMVRFTLYEGQADDWFRKRMRNGEIHDISQLFELLGKRQERLYEIVQKLSDLIVLNAQYEYKDRYGDIVLLGNEFLEKERDDAEDAIPALEHYSLASEWRNPDRPRRFPVRHFRYGLVAGSV